MNLQIKNLKRHSETGVVQSIAWTASKYSDDGKVRVETQGEQVLTPKSPDDPTFIKYFEISEAIAEQWLRESMQDSGIKLLDEYLDAVLQQKIKPQSEDGSPWEKELEAVRALTTEAPAVTRRTRFPTVQST
jgi:hypothetical protein